MVKGFVLWLSRGQKRMERSDLQGFKPGFTGLFGKSLVIRSQARRIFAPVSYGLALVIVALIFLAVSQNRPPLIEALIIFSWLVSSVTLLSLLEYYKEKQNTDYAIGPKPLWYFALVWSYMGALAYIISGIFI